MKTLPLPPTVHSNGTDGETLQRETQAAYEAARALLEALRNMTVHGRDYYPQGNDVINRATEIHRHRIARVEAMCDDLCATVIAIRTQRGN
jgi:hypothetical protein